MNSQSMNLFSLNGEVAVVIGATGVLGGALAEGLAAAAAKIAVLGRNEERENWCQSPSSNGRACRAAAAPRRSGAEHPPNSPLNAGWVIAA